MTLELYSNLATYGSVYQTSHYMDDTKGFVKWSEENFEYVKYNPRKDVNRYGLSITSLSGGVDGVPDLDSILEYNRENGTEYTENDFATPTPVYDYPSLSKVLDPIKDHICRSHVLRMDPGGFFPPHRDFGGDNFTSYRILIPLQNMNPPDFSFIVEDKIQNWVNGYLYFLDAAKMHYLFNASFASTYMIVLNVVINKHTVDFVTKNLRYR